MTDKEKEVEEIKTILYKGHQRFVEEIEKGFSDKNYRSKIHDKSLHDLLAGELVNEGYGNIKQAQIKILEKLKEKLTNFVDGDNEEQVLSKIEACMEVEICIDELIKEIRAE